MHGSHVACLFLQAEQPLNYLRIDGRPARLFAGTEQYRGQESMEGMLPWNGDRDNMIDRFDGRALLDFYREPVPGRQRKTADEEMLDEVCLPLRMHLPLSEPKACLLVS